MPAQLFILGKFFGKNIDSPNEEFVRETRELGVALYNGTYTEDQLRLAKIYFEDIAKTCPYPEEIELLENQFELGFASLEAIGED